MTNTLKGSDAEAVEIVKALGIPDPMHVSRIILDLPATGVARVYVQRFAQRSQVDVLLDVLRKRPVEVVEESEAP